MRGVNRQLRVWLCGNVLGPLLLWWFDTDLTLRAEGAISTTKLITYDRAYMVLLGCSLTLLTCMYHCLYGSDPGSPDSLVTTPIQSTPCQQCHMTSPTLRVRHDYESGKCIVKFDHYCLLINAAVGDKNHALFLGYCALQWFLVLWGWMLAWHAVSPCYNLFDHAAARMCWHHSVLRGLVLLWGGFCLTIAAFVFTLLVVFHTYLATTNQTTYEMMKNSSVSYLKPYYNTLPHWQPPLDYQAERLAGRRPKPRLPVVWVLIYQHLSGKGYHPRPFDQGLVENLEQFFYSKKPCVHKAQMQPEDVGRLYAAFSED